MRQSLAGEAVGLPSLEDFAIFMMEEIKNEERQVVKRLYNPFFCSSSSSVGPMITNPINCLHIGKKRDNSVSWGKKDPTVGFIPIIR